MRSPVIAEFAPPGSPSESSSRIHIDDVPALGWKLEAASRDDDRRRPGGRTSGVYRENFIEGVIRRLGAHGVLYASSYPLLDPRLQIRCVRWSAFSATAAAALVGGNACAVFGLADA